MPMSYLSSAGCPWLAVEYWHGKVSSVSHVLAHVLRASVNHGDDDNTPNVEGGGGIVVEYIGPQGHSQGHMQD